MNTSNGDVAPEFARQAYLDALVTRYERASFVDRDPISVPHAFDDPRDQEVIGLYAALLAWGRRETVLAKMASLCERMHFRPYDFVLRFDVARDGPRLEGFRHRTFQPVDALWFTSNLSTLLRAHGSLEAVFADAISDDSDVGNGIERFSTLMASISPESPARMRKHLARPSAGGACKRLNMYLRWMVRPGPVDLGIWNRIHPSQLVLPLDVHSGRTARALGLLERRSDDWRAAIELTEACRRMAPSDPCRYDFVFFGAGVSGELQAIRDDATAP